MSLYALDDTVTATVILERLKTDRKICEHLVAHEFESLIADIGLGDSELAVQSASIFAEHRRTSERQAARVVAHEEFHAVRGAGHGVECTGEEYFGEAGVDALLDVVRNADSADGTPVAFGADFEVEFVRACFDGHSV